MQRILNFPFWLALIAIAISVIASGSWQWITGFVTLALIGWKVLRLDLQGWNFFSPLLAFPLAYLVYYLIGSFPLTDAQNATNPFLYIAVLVGAVGYAFGILCGLQNKQAVWIFPNRFQPSIEALSFAKPRLAQVVAMGSFFVGFVLLAISYRQTGIPALSKEVSELRIAATDNGYLTSLWISLFWISSIVSFSLLLVEGRRLTARSKWLLSATLGLTLLALYSTGNRGMMLNPLVVMFIFYNLSIRLVSPNMIIRTATTGFCIVALLGFSRNFSAWGISYLFDLKSAGYPDSVIWLVPALEYIRNGSHIFSIFLEIVPEKINHTLGILTISPLGNIAWHIVDKLGLDAGPKIESIDFFLKSALNLDFTGFGVAGSMLTGFYIDGGLLGIFLGLAFCGLLSVWGYSKLIHNYNVPNAFLWAYLTYHMLFSLYGSIFNYITNLTIPMTLYFILKATALSSPPSQGEPSPRSVI